jgi:hypothetical protein
MPRVKEAEDCPINAEHLLSRLEESLDDAGTWSTCCNIMESCIRDRGVENAGPHVRDIVGTLVSGIARCISKHRTSKFLLVKACKAFAEAVVCVKEIEVQDMMVASLLEGLSTNLLPRKVKKAAYNAIWRLFEERVEQARSSLPRTILSVVEKKLEEGNHFLPEGMDGTEFCHFACEAISHMSSHMAQQLEEVDLGVILRAMKAFRSSHSFQRTAVEAIAIALHKNKRNCTRLAKTGPTAILDAWIEHVQHDDVVYICYQALHTFAETHPACLAEENFLNEFIKQMEANMKNVLCQGCACSLVGFMVSTENTLHERMLKAGCIPYLAKVVKTHERTEPGEFDVLDICCKAIACIVQSVPSGDQQSKSCIVTQGGAQAIIKVSSLRPKKQLVQETISNALRKLLCSHPENIALVGKKALPAFAGIIQATEDMLVYHDCLHMVSEILNQALLNGLQQFHEYQHVVSECHGIQALIKCLRTFEKDESLIDTCSSVMGDAFMTLGRACADNYTNQDICNKEDAMHIILRLSQKQKKNKKLQSEAYSALHSLSAGHDGNKAVFLGQDFAKHLFRWQKLERDHADQHSRGRCDGTCVHRGIEMMMSGHDDVQVRGTVHVYLHAYM